MKGRLIKRHLQKTITWRIIGTLDTIIISWVISGSPLIGLQIGLAEVLTKMLLYFLHERIWLKVNMNNDNQKSIIKAITWRIIGTLDTVLLSWIITDSPIIGLQIGFVEVLTKLILYYLHERAWSKNMRRIDRK